MNVIKSNTFRHIPILIIVVIFAFGYLGNSTFEMIVAVCGALFWLVQLLLSFLLNKEIDTQKEKCKALGFILLIPATGLIAVGLMLFSGRICTKQQNMPTTLLGFQVYGWYA